MNSESIQEFLLLMLVAIVVALMAGCDSEAAIRQQQQEAVQRVANSCIPELGEEKLLRWTMGAEGHWVLYVTVRKPMALRGNVVQYVIVSEDELQ